MAIDTVTESARDSRESFEVTNPADGSVIATVPLDGPAEVAATVARVRANQPAWEALGIKGRAQWLDKLRDWILDHQDEIADTMQRETGKVRGEAAGEAVYLPDLINFYGKKARQVHRRREDPRALAADEDQEAQGPVPALSGRRRDQPLELPADPLARRRDPRADRGRRCRHQALRDHAPRPDRDRRGLEERDRRPRCLRRRQRHGRDGLGAGGRGRFRPVHRLRPDRQEGARASGRDA